MWGDAYSAKYAVAPRAAIGRSRDSEAVVLEPGHRLTQGHPLETAKPETGEIDTAPEWRKAATQMEGEALVTRCQPSPSAPHRVIAEREDRGGTAQRGASDQQLQNLLLQRPVIPAARADA